MRAVAGTAGTTGTAGTGRVDAVEDNTALMVVQDRDQHRDTDLLPAPVQTVLCRSSARQLSWSPCELTSTLFSWWQPPVAFCTSIWPTSWARRSTAEPCVRVTGYRRCAASRRSAAVSYTHLRAHETP